MYSFFTFYIHPHMKSYVKARISCIFICVVVYIGDADKTCKTTVICNVTTVITQ